MKPYLCLTLLLTWASVASGQQTSTTAESSVAIGTTVKGGFLTSGLTSLPTSVNLATNITLPGTGTADSRMEAQADYGALRLRGTVHLAAPHSSGIAGGQVGGDPTGTAQFDDHITIGGIGAGPQVFRVSYALTGFAGQTGAGSMQFGAKLAI
jgi:hypothetical protein